VFRLIRRWCSDSAVIKGSRRSFPSRFPCSGHTVDFHVHGRMLLWCKSLKNVRSKEAKHKVQDLKVILETVKRLQIFERFSRHSPWSTKFSVTSITAPI
jgi:hypothetical protein